MSKSATPIGSFAAANWRCRTAGLLVVLGIAPAIAWAHKPSDSYLTLDVQGADVQVRWDVALRDLDNELGLDADGDGSLNWGEVRRRESSIDGLLQSSLHVAGDGVPCKPISPDSANAAAVSHAIDTHSDGNYLVHNFQLRCARAPAQLEVEYLLFAASDPTHRGIMRLRGRDSANKLVEQTAVLGPDRQRQLFQVGSVAPLSVLREFVVEGIWHIWLGFDHILFLLALLLSSVLLRSPGSSGWQPAPHLRPAIVDVLKIVTAFTVAHSITLTLSVLGWVSLPSRLVESAIAITVLLAALNNLKPVMHDLRWVAAFVFGLIHGFGFAGALRDLGLPAQALALSLFGFNVGVELGQLAIVSVFFPLAFALRTTMLYRRGVLGAGSVAIAILALVWATERIFDLRLIGSG